MAEFQRALAFEAFGARIGVEASASIAPRVRPGLPPAAQPITAERLDVLYRIELATPVDGSTEVGYSLSCDGVDTGYIGGLDEVCGELESDMHFHVAVAARNYLFVHAGVVEWREVAIVIPGRTFAGKSSLVMALVEAGARYFSDEYAVFDEEGRVYPYLKPLSQRREGKAPLLHPPQSLGGKPGTSPVPLGRTVITGYRKGAVWNPSPITRAQAMMALFDNTVVAKAQPEFALSVLSNAVEGSDGLEGDRGEAAEVAAALLDAKRPPREDTRGEGAARTASEV